MSKQIIVIGDTFGEAWTKQNENNTELYAAVTLVGDTASRPATPEEGSSYIDTDLGYIIWYYNSNWHNATGAIV